MLMNLQCLIYLEMCQKVSDVLNLWEPTSMHIQDQNPFFCEIVIKLFAYAYSLYLII